ESLGELTLAKQEELIKTIGNKKTIEEIKQTINFVFLALHGPYAEDGTIQGALDFYNIPYSGSGVLSSAIGIDKAIQKQLMLNAGFNCPLFLIVNRKNWLLNKKSLFNQAKQKIGFPMVIKASTQGSSIGVSILQEDNLEQFIDAVNKSFFITELTSVEWNKLTETQKNHWVRTQTDIREGIGLPLNLNGNPIYNPDDLLIKINQLLATQSSLTLEAFDSETQILIEQFIEGKEFSCIVIEDENEKPIALPPTEIRKGKELFDYRSKYLPGLSRKITPIELPIEQIEQIRKTCEKLFTDLHFGVYARIDGFIKKDGTIYLNDPNTTSGMMPSSFFFHQAAEIGLNPSQFLTYIIRTSLAKRLAEHKQHPLYKNLLNSLDKNIDTLRNSAQRKVKVAVMLGGYSSERHISVESGRNIYEKLSSSSKYTPVPVFVSGNYQAHNLHVIPINILLKDNADDIKEKIDHWQVHPIIHQIIKECGSITAHYSSANSLAAPYLITYQELATECSVVFIALHGRPGEDGVVQTELEQVGLPYNGSGVDSSKITINKYQTNEILKQNGLLVAEHTLLHKQDYLNDNLKTITKIEQQINYPFIAKPVDDGCSSAVKKIKNRTELEAFIQLIFREGEELLKEPAKILGIKPKEEFPNKEVILIEELISKKDAAHFLEITGGMLTRFNEKGELVYEVFEASEALSEGDVLSLEEKFLAGQGQNITPARYAKDTNERQRISNCVKADLEKAAKALNITGYTRIDAFVRVYKNGKVETIFVEANSLPGMTPATCIFHQCAINGYKPYDFIDRILDFGIKRFKKAPLNS
ncbi:MAG: D-alanine--D-alanine ligase, partial [Bacteroidia bacterium]|nr:D-alanine--D-alanine ligase [Bacteroidia bacterium]